ncbi:MAG: GGDEF domain-containing protein, partial [Giesbergeria sp.]|nr:GGDEF domain-containing protein [Giesbergeria sp.]
TQVIDLTMEIMSQAYSSSRDRNSRAKEAYRLFAVSQNVSTERERRRAALLDWENQLMFDHAVGLQSMQLPRLGASEFGLWFRHKGTHAFQGSPETEAILHAIQHIDEVLLPAFAQPGGEAQRIPRLRELREHSKRIAFQLDALFEQNSELESGRDVLTRLLSRKFLPVVLGKSVDHARTTGASFAVLAIDIDHFKRINDGHGHEAGDMVLQQMAALLSHHTRGGDYLFRLGGEEFLLLLVDTPRAGAQRAAQKLCQQVAAEAFHLPREQTLHVTVSIGVAAFNGHPDYQTLLRRADAALYQAKHAGRNGVVVAED